jgi:Domain of unknown function (DUF4118)
VNGSCSPRLDLSARLLPTLLVTAALIAFREDLPSVVPFGLMLGVCVAASWGSSVWSGVYAGVMGALFYDFFFTEPYGEGLHSRPRRARSRLRPSGQRRAVGRPRPHGPGIGDRGRSRTPKTWRT